MLYQGDDLINVLTIRISAPEGEELPEIKRVDVKIGPLVKRYDNPTNPFTINLLREESIKLSVKNNIYACIWYEGTVNGKTKLLKRTCKGTVTLVTNPEIINDRCKC